MSNILLVDIDKKNRDRREKLKKTLERAEMQVETPDESDSVSKQYTFALVHIGDFNSADRPKYEERAKKVSTPVIWYSGGQQIEESVLHIARGDEYSDDEWKGAINILKERDKKAFLDFIKSHPIRELVAKVSPICILGKEREIRMFAGWISSKLDTNSEKLLEKMKLLGKENVYNEIRKHLITISVANNNEAVIAAQGDLSNLLTDIARGYL